MLTVDNLISFGYWRKYYHETVAELSGKHLWSKGDIKNYGQVRSDLYGEDANAVREEMLAHNARVMDEAREGANNIMHMVVESFNRTGETLDQIKERYKAG